MDGPSHHGLTDEARFRSYFSEYKVLNDEYIQFTEISEDGENLISFVKLKEYESVLEQWNHGFYP